VLWAKLPEPVRFLALQNVGADRIASALRRISPEIDLAGMRFLAVQKPSGPPVVQLFRNGLAAGTLMLWVTFFMSMLIFYLLSGWLPILSTSAGFLIKSASLMSTTLAIGGIVGAIAISRLMDIFNPPWVLAGFYFLAAIFISLLGLSTSAPLVLVLAVFGAGFGIAGAQVGLNALAAAHYQTAYRATGVSWANGVGRFGSVLGSMIGDVLLSMGWGACNGVYDSCYPGFRCRRGDADQELAYLGRAQKRGAAFSDRTAATTSPGRNQLTAKISGGLATCAVATPFDRPGGV
jgi:AAHS family 4-hydroxybenzoate transporter-like MFS transporter